MDGPEYIYEKNDVQSYVVRIQNSLRLGHFDRAIAIINEGRRSIISCRESTLVGDRSVISLLEAIDIEESIALRIANSLEESDFKAIRVRDLIKLVPIQLRSVANFGVGNLEPLQQAFATAGLTWPVLVAADEPFFFVLDKPLALRLQECGYLKFGDLPRSHLYLDLHPKGWKRFEIDELSKEYDKYGH